jgi:hypothetical protein
MISWNPVHAGRVRHAQGNGEEGADDRGDDADQDG